MRTRTWLTTAVALALVAGAASGCSDTTKPGMTRASLSFAGVPRPAVGGAMSVANALGDTLVVVSGANTLKITSVEVVLRQIELKRTEASQVACDTANASEDLCEEFEVGTQLVGLPLAPGVTTTVTINVPAGSYDEVQFEIHRPGSDAADLSFLALHPGFAGVSIRVRGLYNGTPFTYTSNVSAEEEHAIDPPLVVTGSGGSVNLTVQMDLSTWFKDAGTGALIDPSTANPGGANESVVRSNIKNSISAFEDDNRDGQDDSHETGLHIG